MHRIDWRFGILFLPFVAPFLMAGVASKIEPEEEDIEGGIVTDAVLHRRAGANHNRF